MKLFEVEISGHVYVLAKTSHQAQSIAADRVERHDLRCDAFDPDDEGIWAGWENSEPYNSDGRTVGQILKKIRKERKEKEFWDNQPKLPFGEGFE